MRLDLFRNIIREKENILFGGIKEENLIEADKNESPTKGGKDE